MTDSYYESLNPREKALLDCAKKAFDLLQLDSNEFEMYPDVVVIREAFEKAAISLGHAYTGSPNEIKKIGHKIFWIRKLKPIQIQRKEISDVPDVNKAGQLFINEYTAILFGFVSLELCGHKPTPSVRLVHDLAANLRYSSFSPGSISAIIESMITTN